MKGVAPLALAALLLACNPEARKGEPDAPAADAAASVAASSAPQGAQSASSPAPAATASQGPDNEDPYARRVESHDGRLVAVSAYDHVIGKSTLRLEKADGSASTVLVDMKAFGADNAPDPGIVQLASEILAPMFSRDDKTIYFMANAWGTEHAVYSVDAATRKVRYVASSNSLFVIDKCATEALLDLVIVVPHHGRRVLRFHDVDPLDWTFAVDRTGKTFGAVGNFDAFMKAFCSPAPGEEPRKLAPRPPRLQQITCDGREIKAYTVYLLEGGTASLFYSLSDDKRSFERDFTADEHIRLHCPEKLPP